MDQLLKRVCPVCGDNTATPFLQKGRIPLTRCRKCAMIYVNPVSRTMATGSFYNDAGAEYLSPEKLESDYASVRFERELRLFRRYCPQGSVLDVGCSSGAFLYQLKQRYPGDYRILGTDVSKEPLDHAASMGVPIISGNFPDHFFGQSFDAVTFWAVMEHLSQPERFLEKAANILKPGGLCFILVPNMNSLAVRLLGAKYRYIFAEHLNYFTSRTLANFVRREFMVLAIKTTHFNPLVIWQDWHRGEREVPRTERSRLLKRTTGYKKSLWLRPVKWGYVATEFLLDKMMLGDNLVIVARKI